jgi:hypothetical protein
MMIRNFCVIFAIMEISMYNIILARPTIATDDEVTTVISVVADDGGGDQEQV